MKRVISILLTLAMLMGAVVTFSVSVSAEPEEEFKVGYAREDITPEEFPFAEKFSGVNDNIYATAVAFSDGDTTAILITLDIVYLSNAMHSSILESITELTGIAASSIYIHSTHNHSSPNYVTGDYWYEDGRHLQVRAWIAKVVENASLAAKNAVADLAVSEIYTGKSTTEGLNFVRRPQYDQNVDEEIQAIRFVREGKKDVVLANWQAHPASTENVGLVTADYVGRFRELVEEENDVWFAYFNGANGNLNVKIPNVQDKLTEVNAIGEALAAKLNAMLADDNVMKKTRTGKIRTAASDYDAEIAPVDNETKAKVLQIYEDGKITSAEVTALGVESDYVVRALKKRIDLTADGSTTTPIHLAAMSFGEVGFVFAPYEMFDDNGVEIKEASPFETTFICTLIGGHNYEYIHSDSEYGKGVYEVWVCIFTRGIGERLAQSFVSLLNETVICDDISTSESASIRLSADNSGIRFKTTISKEYIDELVFVYGKENVKVGTLIAPSDTIKELPEFTKAALDEAEITYVDVKATLDRPYDSNENENIYTGSLTNIKLKNLRREFSAVGYVAVDGVGYFYSDTIAQKAVYNVAVIALSDLKAESEGKYTNEAYVGGRTFYSKYTEEERDIMLKFMNEPRDPFDTDIFGNGSSATLPERELTEFEERFSIQNEYLLSAYKNNVKAGDVREDIPSFSKPYTSCVPAGDNGYTYIYENVTSDTYEAYCAMLKSRYFAQYTENEFSGTNGNNYKNYFATFISEITQVDIEFHSAASRMYVNLTPRTASVLPLREAPTYTAAGAQYPTVLVQVGHEDLSSSTSSLCLIIRIADGSFVIVDGGIGTEGVNDKIYETLVKLAPDPDDIVISAWIITHADWDHIAGFSTFAEKYRDAENITLKQMVYNYPDNSLLLDTDDHISIKNRHNNTENWANMLGDDVEILKPHTGNVLYYADIKINVLYTQEDYLVRGTSFGNYNTSSLVLQMVTSDGTKIFIGGDHPVDGSYQGYDWCEGAIYRWYGNFIESYVCTTFHHGYGGGADEAGVVYTVIRPKVVLWCANQSKIDESNLTNQTRNNYFTTNGVANGVTYYVAGDNVQVMTFDDGKATVNEYGTFADYKNS